MAQQFLQNASLNLDRQFFEDYIEAPVPDEVWEYMQNIPILTMDDWYSLFLQATEYTSQNRGG